MVPLEYIRLHYVPQYKTPVKYYAKSSFLKAPELLAAEMVDISLTMKPRWPLSDLIGAFFFPQKI